MNTRKDCLTTKIKQSFLCLSTRSESDERYEHFLKRDASMLESAGIVLHVLVVVVGIGEEVLVVSVYEGT